MGKRLKKTFVSFIFLTLFLILLGYYYKPFIDISHAQSSNYGTVKSYQKISDTNGSFTGILADDDEFGSSVASIGDLDNDGVTDVAIGAYGDDDGGTNHGAVWILFMNSDGTVKSHQKISDTQGGFTGTLSDGDSFGMSVASIGDLDNDNNPDLAVGAMYDNDGGTARGAVWILFLNSNGTVRTHQKISSTQGSFTGTLDDNDYFGSSMAGLSDLNGDTVEDIAVGAQGDDDGNTNRGAVWVLFLNSSGTVNSLQKISDTQGNFNGVLDNGDLFGESITSLGNLDASGALDIAVGASGDDDGGSNHGSAWILFLNSDGTVSSYQKISDMEGNFSGVLNSYDYFGCSLTQAGDLDGDNVTDLVIGAEGVYNGTRQFGAVWVLFLNSSGTVKSEQKIDTSEGNFTGTYTEDDYFGSAVVNLGDINNDKMEDILVGSRGDDDGGSMRGAGWILNLNSYYVSNLINIPSNLTAVLTSDWATDVEVNGQNGNLEVGIIHNPSNYRTATLSVDFSEDRDWSQISAGSSLNKAFFHYPGGFNSIPGATGNGFTLYVPRNNGNAIGICPGASSLDDINSNCPDIYYLSLNNTNVSVSTEGGVEYWKISGLVSSGGFSTDRLPETGSRTTLTTYTGVMIVILDLIIYYILFKKKSYLVTFKKF
ncbi:FG-GAP repeat protein [Candidatus Dojkabacteria bacterium]|nr:FG-GAP repeat protein [Candidatus Dojkabacteria bacterium]